MMIYFKFRIQSLTSLAMGLIMLVGCQTPGAYRKSADESAGAIIQEKQMEALGKDEPFAISSPEESLRKKLLMGQNLPYTGPASLGTDHLEPIDHWPEKGPGRPSATEDTVQPTSMGALTLIEALQVGARHSRERIAA